MICPALVAEGHQVSVINGTYGEREIVDSEGVKIIYTPFSKKRGYAWWYNFASVDREIELLHDTNPIDVVEGSELSFAFIKKREDISYVIRLHGGHHFFAEGEQRAVNRWKGYQESRSFKKADGFIGVSEYVVSHTRKFLKMDPRPIQVIMYPINLKIFSPSSFDDMIPYRIAFAGTIIEKKGIRQLCLAMEQVSAKFPEAELHAYGRDWKDSTGNSFLEKLKKIIPDSLSEKIIFHGSVEQKDLPGIYSKANLCAFPSHIETLGLVAPEAMAMERPVLYTSVGPGPEVITDGDSGWLCDPHDSEEIASKIIEAFSDQKEMKRRATRGREKVAEQFNIKNILSQNLSFYQKINSANRK